MSRIAQRLTGHKQRRMIRNKFEHEAHMAHVMQHRAIAEGLRDTARVMREQGLDQMADHYEAEAIAHDSAHS